MSNPLAVLIEHFPHCFFKRGQEKPLKVGIHTDLFAKIDDANHPFDLSRTQCRQALRMYALRPTYLAAMLPNAERINLKGKGEGKVSSEHSRQAFALLKKMRSNQSKTQQNTKRQANKKEECSTS